MYVYTYVCIFVCTYIHQNSKYKSVNVEEGDDMCCSVLQCVAACCSMLQRVAACMYICTNMEEDDDVNTVSGFGCSYTCSHTHPLLAFVRVHE